MPIHHDNQPPPNDTLVGIAPDAETILAPPVDYPETPAAWSSESVELLAEVERRTWSEAAMRAAGIAAGALITAVLIAAAGLAIIMAKPGQELSVTVPQTPGVNPGAVTLPRSALPRKQPEMMDGAYKLVFDLPNAEYRGNAASPTNVPKQTSWWAFRSQCSATGECVATGIQLDASDHLSASPFHDGTPGPSVTDTLIYQDGEWKEIQFSIPNNPGPPGCPTGTTRRILQIQPDGSLLGTQTDIMVGTCQAAGNTTVIPVMGTRIGQVPPGVFGQQAIN